MLNTSSFRDLERGDHNEENQNIVAAMKAIQKTIRAIMMWLTLLSFMLVVHVVFSGVYAVEVYVGNSTVSCELQLGQTSLSSSLVAHPHYHSLHVSPFMMPADVSNNTQLGVYHDDNDVSLDKRYLWWFLAAAKLVDTGLALYELVTSCQDWSSGGASAKIGCVHGALSTAFTAAGAGWYTWNKYIEIGNRLVSFGKRDSSTNYQSHLKYLEYYVNLTNLPAALVYNSDGDLHYSDAGETPVVLTYTATGTLVHFTASRFNETTFISRWGKINGLASKRDEQFNEQDFTQGGIEFSHIMNQDDNSRLSTSNDYGQMDHEVSCLFGDKPGNTYEYQIYDNNHKSTITGGIVKAFQYDTYDVSALTGEFSSGTPENQACEVS
ncbi:uncharacterized protein AC631_05909 [Debaryomyces fabryi]|uniref:Uncharacterized protein n=1 Tax=Debaryomyces fabryi TaxID=58627 RepID=A0A0V1PQJ4_9ASCO|nr:uncharacterized protein AC631_05909 [Debaryomyces fabryi]KRZ98331.1 hypothetical protein AC631_05909 [Debaryomyces fabryi]CUM51869.1 unnamed protein product [Debaryomyces fabryi]